MRRSLLAAEEGHPTGIDLVETELLGTLIVCPLLRLDCQGLKRSDFKSPFRGAAFTAIMAERHPELGLVVARLEAAGEAPPAGRTGWADALNRAVMRAFVEDDAVKPAVRVIREAALHRKSEARTHAT